MKNYERRVLLGGAVTAGAALALAAGDRPARAQAPVTGPITVLSTLDQLRGFERAIAGTLFFLEEPGREGLFRCVAGAVPRGDPLEGLFVRSRVSGVHFARIWDGIEGRPEWFGARVNDGEADCAPAIEACFAMCPVTQLAQADYFIRRTLRFHLSWRTVRGVGSYATDQGQGTRIILAGGAPGVNSDDIVVIGSVDKPGGGSDDYPIENHFSNFVVVRDGPCRPHPSRDIRRYPTGIRVGYVTRSSFRELSSLESSVGFYVGGIVYSRFDDCHTQRLEPGTTPRDDFFVGYFLDGAIEFGYAGGNASLYMNRCIAVGQHPQHVDAAGLRGLGAFVDTFLDNFESARIATGIHFGVAGARRVGQTIDLHIRGAVLDGCSKAGINLHLDSTSSASVEIIDPYIYSAVNGGEYGIMVHEGAGLTTITGGQVHGDFRGANLWFSRTRGVRVQGTKIQQALKPVLVEDSSAIHLEPQISNSGKAVEAFAITCRGMARSYVRPTIIGAGHPSFRGGIELIGGTNFSQVDGSLIDPGCFTAGGDASFKIWCDGGDIRRDPHQTAFRNLRNVVVGVLD